MSLFLHLILIPLSLSFTAKTYGTPLSVITYSHQDLHQCLIRFKKEVEQNQTSIMADAEKNHHLFQSIKNELDERWGLWNWAEKTIDRITHDEWDWEHPSHPITLSGKYRAHSTRAKIKERQARLLADILALHPTLIQKNDLLFKKMEMNHRFTKMEWENLRSQLRKREMEYYDFLGDLTRQQVHERGFVDVVSWNKTMGLLQENFYRNLSCVTEMDQLAKLIPRVMKHDRSYRLVEEERPKQKHI